MLISLLLLAAASTLPSGSSAPINDEFTERLYFLLYCIPGVIVAFLQVRDGFDLNDREDRKTVIWAALFLIPLWPIVLLAWLANRDWKKKPEKAEAPGSKAPEEASPAGG
jgi:hypothetical protein